MAPKRKAATQHPEAPTVKKEQPEEQDSFRSTVEALKAAPKEKRKARVDPLCPLSKTANAQVYEDYDCTLNQTHIDNNNNKFYLIQLIKESGSYSCWNRWGRVGETGQSKLSSFPSLDDARRNFEKKFQEKTKNKWAERDHFVAHAGKYTLIEVHAEEEGPQEVTVKIDSTDGSPSTRQCFRPCTLDQATQELISLIFSNDMFNDAMKSMNLDVKKMPLGKLSKLQIARGFEALEALEAALQESPASSRLKELSSQFYTIIPHNFGRNRPPTLDSLELLQAKKDMLLVLADIELAQALKASQKEEKEKVEEVPHPLDRNYQLLKCQLHLLEPGNPKYQLIETYVKKTGPTYRKLQILHVWEVDREGEGELFQAHEKLGNRRLLWHGTNVAVVAAILKSGLRIMPHSGGRVGRGIYFASENSKSAAYVCCTAQKIGIMFLNEVALGREHHIVHDDPSLRQPPPGYNSVVARGQTEPDPTQDKELLLDGHQVLVPQGPPVPIVNYSNSYFSQSEYLIYQESQCRIRYLLQLHF
ncbi:protein mono-ADP-ribosyltransferase PARP3 [Tachyglossus aculeatus]|uniref:protein mono-ADP-ribosyltransferase PARP3 n=1 Tax=Tachyglossus aculeatus TaxID=9261 RepID=UPI0018F3C54D|nr:protein mono-ADP-ribosyltransferase PARP3 [Tachyglossus aculeatus]